MIRGGGVIPHILEVVKPAPNGADLPKVPFNIEGVNAVEIGRSNEQEIAELVKALRTLGAEDVGPATVAKMYNAGLKTIDSIYNADTAKFVRLLPGVKDKWQNAFTMDYE